MKLRRLFAAALKTVVICLVALIVINGIRIIATNVWPRMDRFPVAILDAAGYITYADGVRFNLAWDPKQDTSVKFRMTRSAQSGLFWKYGVTEMTPYLPVAIVHRSSTEIDMSSPSCKVHTERGTWVANRCQWVRTPGNVFYLYMEEVYLGGYFEPWRGWHFYDRAYLNSLDFYTQPDYNLYGFPRWWGDDVPEVTELF